FLEGDGATRPVRERGRNRPRPPPAGPRGACRPGGAGRPGRRTRPPGFAARGGGAGTTRGGTAAARGARGLPRRRRLYLHGRQPLETPREPFGSLEAKTASGLAGQATG